MLVLIEKTSSGYRASSGKPLEAETEGKTRDEALIGLRELLARRLQGEIEIIEMEIPGESRHAHSPFLRLHNVFKDDPSFDEWQVTIIEARRIENEAAGIYPERNQ